MDDTDLAGPLVFCLAFGTFLLLVIALCAEKQDDSVDSASCLLLTLFLPLSYHFNLIMVLSQENSTLATCMV